MKKKTLALHLLFVLFNLLSVTSAIANNIQVSTPTFTGYNSSSQVVNVACSVSWDNSWRNATNYDAAWVFVKYRINKGEWQHAKLSTTVADYTVPNGTTLVTVPDGGGVFLHRSSNASNSTFSVSNLQLSWPYGLNNVPNNANLEVKVFALEMVYVPQGSFYVGNGTTQTGYSFYVAGSTNISFPINSEARIVVDNVAPNATLQANLGVTQALWSNGFLGNSALDPYDSIPATFPKGFNAFYCMKYELTQSAYVDFLNTLNYTQQSNRTISSPSSAAGTAALVLNNATRNGIDIMTPGIAPGKPAVYACNLDGDNNFNENNDGAFIACNGLSWADLGAYLDWAALRPMTEFEYEKACRGTGLPRNNEFAWGDDSISAVNYGTGGLDNVGTPTERIKNVNYGTLGNGGMQTTMQTISAPLRVGIFADHASNNNNRRSSGASFYGCMEMSGNVQERCITIFSKNVGRLFNGTHGDGLLSIDGNSNTTTWPDTDADGIGFRGGSYNYSNSISRVSARNYVSPISPARFTHAGGRGVRTAP